MISSSRVIHRWRWSGAAILAAAVTGALFALMQQMIAGGDGAYVRPPAPLALDFIRVRRDGEPLEKQRVLPPKFPTDKARPPSPMPRLARPLQRPAPNVRPPLYVPDVGVSFDAAGLSLSSGAGAPRAHPIYPPSAERRGIEGWVKVSFTIAEDGRVVDARVVDADPRGVFERSALRAVSKWRYPSRTIDGQPIRRTGVEVTIEFQLRD